MLLQLEWVVRLAEAGMDKRLAMKFLPPQKWPLLLNTTELSTSLPSLLL